jgi:hypothetical protein
MSLSACVSETRVGNVRLVLENNNGIVKVAVCWFERCIALLSGPRTDRAPILLSGFLRDTSLARHCYRILVE